MQTRSLSEFIGVSIAVGWSHRTAGCVPGGSPIARAARRRSAPRPNSKTRDRMDGDGDRFQFDTSSRFITSPPWTTSIVSGEVRLEV